MDHNLDLRTTLVSPKNPDRFLENLRFGSRTQDSQITHGSLLNLEFSTMKIFAVWITLVWFCEEKFSICARKRVSYDTNMKPLYFKVF